MAQIKALNTYPYEFALSKAQKHLNVIYESHKVYVSLHFLTAMLLSFRLLMKAKVWIVNKVLLGVFTIMFTLAIVYSQAITTVLALIVIIGLFPFFYFRGRLSKMMFISGIIILITIGSFIGVFDTYANKNTTSVFKLFSSVFKSDTVERGVDKRIYIYDCSVDLIKKQPFFGYGVGDVQKKLNECYSEKNYKIAEYQSTGTDINSHNYYLNMWLSAGFLGLGSLIFLFIYNLILAFRVNEYIYVFFLLAFALSLLTENILVRMAGVFLFAVFNALFYSISTIDVQRKR
ncbi:O-antigen ligase family protein [Maribacter sp. 2-571]|uniref:O-antigen ligase family protein n=1 Tax=Maribacter sp. 2-571 TaxID=3417569 RepID=UPI003D353F85